MYQIDVSSAAATLPASTGPGTPGFFSDGNPATGTPATIVPAEFLNAVMLEILNVLDAASITPVKNNNAQLLSAINQLIDESIPADPDAATTDQPGIVELATPVETINGTDPGRAVTPEGLAALINYLNFGTAAFKNAQGSVSDTTAGALMLVGAFGLGTTFGLGNIDLNTVLNSGFYRYEVATNGPGVDYSPLIVCRAGDTVSQIVVAYSNGNIYVRGASGIPSSPSWTPWRTVFSTANTSATIQALLGAADADAARSAISAISSADVPTTIAGMSAGAVGTYSFCRNMSGTGLNPGDTIAGSNLRYAWDDGMSGISPAGTWRCMGAVDYDSITIFMRIA